MKSTEIMRRSADNLNIETVVPSLEVVMCVLKNKLSYVWHLTRLISWSRNDKTDLSAVVCRDGEDKHNEKKWRNFFCIRLSLAA